MKHSKLKYKLNWRQILLHFIAACLISFAFRQFAFLTNTEKFTAIEILNIKGQAAVAKYLEGKNFTFGEAITYFFYAKSAWIIGLLLFFITSIIIAKRRNWFWVNSLIVLTVVFFLGRQDYWDWTYLKSIFLKPGLIFRDTTAYLLTNGIVLLSLGLFVLFHKKFNDFIDSKPLTN